MIERPAAERAEQQKPALEQAFGQQKADLEAQAAQIQAEESKLKESLKEQAGPKLASEAARLQQELTKAQEREQRAAEYLAAVKNVSGTAGRHLADLQDQVAQTRAERDYWQRLLQQVKEGEKA